MKKYVFTAALLLTVICSKTGLAVEAAGVQVGGVEVIPAVQVGVSHNDNIFAQETNKKSSLITTIDPALKLVAVNGSNQFEVDYHLSKGFYHSSSNDNYLDHFAGLNADLDLSSRLKSRLWANYDKTHDMRGSTFTGQALTFNTPDEYHQTIVGGQVSYGINARVDVKGEYTNKRYDNHRTITIARDLDTAGGSIALSYPIAPKTSAVVEARYKRFDYKLLTATTNLDSAEQRYYAGLDWEATAKTTGTVRVGYLNKNFSRAGVNDASQFSWELGVLWEPMSYSAWQLSTSGAPGETDGTGSYTESSNVDLTWNHAWNSSLSHTATLGYSQSKYQGTVTPRTDNLTTAGFSLNYDIQRWLTVEAGYNYANRNSNAVNSSYKQNIWSLNVIGSL